ncbi:hypothetical protein A9P82_01025 [Arachidicoccus ginsenosidimutans]|nr:hypothetical protein A9P82_01025 [Arachidicoccus sp. BS20]
MYETYSDAQLVELLNADDEAAFTALYHRYALRLFADVVKLVKNEDRAQEILQEVFIKVWLARDRIDSEKSFRSYVFKIAENQVFGFFRTAARDKKLMEELKVSASEYFMPSEPDTENAESKDAILREVIDRLPPQQKKVLTLCKLEGKSYKEVGEELGLSVSTVKNHIVKGTQTVREHIFNHPDISTGVLLFFIFLNR